MYLTSVAAPAVSKRPKRQRNKGRATTSYAIEKMGRERHFARGFAGGDLDRYRWWSWTGVVVEGLVHGERLVAELEHELEALD